VGLCIDVRLTMYQPPRSPPCFEFFDNSFIKP
jgi:hypothetical protein